jgi:tetratricopeptide (TPR) repeat protein
MWYRVLAVMLAIAIASPSLAGGLDLMAGAEAAAKAGDHDGALRRYTEAIAASDLNASQLALAYYKRGGVYGYLGENIKGIQDYSKSLELNPNFGYALSLRGYLRGAIGQYDLAEKDQQAALALAGSVNSPTYQPWVMQHYADIWRRRGEFDKALDLCARALQINEYNSVYFRRAWIYLDMNRLAEAKAEFARFEKEMQRQGNSYASFWLDERGAIERLRKLR